MYSRSANALFFFYEKRQPTTLCYGDSKQSWLGIAKTNHLSDLRSDESTR